MTYPPQPGPPSGPQGGWQGPPGGFPQQGGFPGGPGRYPSGGPQRKTGLIVGLSLGGVAVLFGVFAILAWVAPGFLLSGDDSGGSGKTGGSGKAAADEGGSSERAEADVAAYPTADALATALVQAVNRGDSDALVAAFCDGHKDDVEEDADEMLAKKSSITVRKVERLDETGGMVEYDGVTSGGNEFSGIIGFRQQDGTEMFCADSFSKPLILGEETSSAPAPSSEVETPEPTDENYGRTTGITDIRTLGQKFVSAVNSGDTATATSLGCPGPVNTGESMIENGKRLRITSVDDDAKEPSAELIVTHSDGDRSEYRIETVRDPTAGDLCIDGLILYIPDEG
ncbi:hypothetical protein GCM10009676_28690 [Prauserella halophila]|uniref:Uncharacterized protein n=1 Tax=Prauserella halophila TaxID=185641 RepID=A0ABN1W9G0_9PSEU|nr:hypothetical protein [Prauserella halophila]MCP2236929.1 hypothetical protein [Prauserella halophila]